MKNQSILLQRMVAGKAPTLLCLESRRLRFADIRRVGTSGVELTSRRRIHRTGNLACYNVFIFNSVIRIHHRHSAEEEVGVGMTGMLKNRLRLPVLADRPQIHDVDPVRNAANYV